MNATALFSGTAFLLLLVTATTTANPLALKSSEGLTNADNLKVIMKRDIDDGKF